MSEYTRFSMPEGREVTVGEGACHKPSAYVGIEGRGGMDAWGWVPKEQAPALALAVLEAAGYVPDNLSDTGSAIRALQRRVEKQEKAKENEQLDKEAQALYEAFAKESVFTQYQWEDLEDAKHPWIAAAKKARELHKGEAKPSRPEKCHRGDCKTATLPHDLGSYGCLGEAK